MELSQATERCKELIKSEHDRWIGLTNQEAIKTVLQVLEKLKKENEELKDKNKILENCKYVNGFEIEKSKAEEKERWRNKIKDRIKHLKEIIRKDEEELKKNPDPVNSRFYSFDAYFEWERETKRRDELCKARIEDLKALLQGE